MKRFLILFSTLLILSAAMASAACAQMHGRRGPAGMHRGQGCNQGYDQPYGQNYQLTEEQQQAMQQVQQEYGEKLQAMAQDLWSKQARLHAELAAKNLDRDKINDLVQEIGELRSRMFATRVDMLLALRDKGISYYGTCMMRGGGMGWGGGMMGPGWGGQGYQRGGQDYQRGGQDYQRGRGYQRGSGDQGQ
jgi:zinc resistance-associated protein